MDIFDIYLPLVVLAPALIYFISPELSPTATAIAGGSIFAATLVGRPLGAFIFGHYAVGAVWGPETKDVDFHAEVGASPTPEVAPRTNFAWPPGPTVRWIAGSS